MNFIFWQNIISPHQSYIIKRLASLHNVVLIVEKQSSSDRLNQGWLIPDTGEARVILLGNYYEVNELLNSNDNFKHIFSGIDSYHPIYEYFKQIVKHQKVYIIAESGIDIGFKRYFRMFKYNLLAYRYDKVISKIYAIGDLGVSWYKSAGFSSDKIVKYQYTIDNYQNLDLSNIGSLNNFYRLTYIGQLIYRKGVDNLIYALSEVKYSNWNLNIIGDGVLKSRLLKLIKDLNLSDKIKLIGVKKNQETLTFLERNTDMLILPSRFDGWGAVVNEALSRGVRVLTNDKCGASCMIKDKNWGHVYSERSKNNLIDSLNTILSEKNNSDILERKKLSMLYNLENQEKVFHDFINTFEKE